MTAVVLFLFMMMDSLFSGQSDVKSKSLPEELMEVQVAFEQKAPKELQEMYQGGLDSLKMAGSTKLALKVGDYAPDFMLSNASGEEVKLSLLLKKGPVVVTWYRGGWCPYCNITLKKLQNELPRFKELGATLIALTPELPDKSMSTQEKNKLAFEVLSDTSLHVAQKYGVVFKLKSDVAANYEKSFALSKYNGNKRAELPFPATFIIDKNQIIRYVFVNEDYRLRADPEELIKVLKTL